jgi:23S rRNA (guanine745-N1)-methyltransferase
MRDPSAALDTGPVEGVPATAVLACPVCSLPLAPSADGLGCANAHAFDVAREGYVNLLLAQHRRSTDPGYSREMIAGRRALFDAGHYERLADGIADLVLSHLPEAPDAGERVVLDAGCGEGYYLRRVRERLARLEVAAGTVRCGVDISKHAVRAAARRDPRGLYAVAGTHRMPVLAGRVDVLLTHFSPVSAGEFRRVVRRGGVVLVGGPGERHLFGLKALLYDAPAGQDASGALDGEPGFELVATHRIRHELSLRGPGQVANLLLMTPFYWSVSRETQERVARLDGLDTEVDVVVHAYLVSTVPAVAEAEPPPPPAGWGMGRASVEDPPPTLG